MTSKVRLWVEQSCSGAYEIAGYYLSEVNGFWGQPIEVDADWWELYKEKARALSDMQHEAAIMAGYEDA